MPAIRLLIQMNRNDVTDDLLQQLAERGRQIEATEPGCLQFEYFRSLANPDKFAIVELWESYEAYDGHWRTVQANRPAPQPGQPAPPRPQNLSEIYQHAVFDVVDGVWAPRDASRRIDSIRWA